MIVSLSEDLRRMLDASPQPAVLIVAQRVAYANRAAIAFLEQDPTGIAVLDVTSLDCARSLFSRTAPGDVTILRDQTFCDTSCDLCVMTTAAGLLVFLSAEQQNSLRRINEEIVTIASAACRDPINTIVSAADALERMIAPESSDDAAPYLKTLQKNCFEILNRTLTIRYLIKECRALSLSKGLIPCDFRAMVKTVLSRSQPLFLERDYQISLSLHPDSLPVLANPRSLPHALIGMLAHLSQFVARHKKISITLAQDNASAQLSVSACGTGLPQPFLEFLSHPTVANREELLYRYGYPLFRILVLAEHYGGSFHAENTGSTIDLVLRLPLIAEAASLCTSFDVWLDADF